MAKKAVTQIRSFRDIWMIALRRLASSLIWDIIISLVLAFLVWIIGGKVIGLWLPGYWEMFRWIYIGIFAIYALYTLGIAAISTLSLKIVCSLAQAPFADVMEALTVHKLQDRKPPAEWKPDWFREELAAARERQAKTEQLANAFMEQLFGAAFGIGRRPPR